MDKNFVYLLGLIIGRGHINYLQHRIIIEFAHKNEILEGIAHCQKCGGLATERKENNHQNNLFCKLCGAIVPSSQKKSYLQQEETLNSLSNAIIPFISKLINAKFLIRGNSHITFLIIDLSPSDPTLKMIEKLLNGCSSFDSFHIPTSMHKEPRDIKIEFINGLMDTASFPAAGGWLNRDGQKGTGRMRSYFQIVRNWHLPVELCNFLRDMNLPIHTIDWGHPNIRDSKMEDYYNSNPTSWSREHQLKFFPEYYHEFSMKLRHKNLMMKELIDHNLAASFSKKEDCDAPSTIGAAKIKAIHLGESDSRIPLPVRCHIDAFWQVCHKMGCQQTNTKINGSKNKDVFYLTGCDKGLNISHEQQIRQRASKDLSDKIIQSYQGATAPLIASQKSKGRIRTTPEADLYEPIKEWLDKDLKRQGLNSKVYDTSSFYLDKFILQNNLFDIFEFCDNYKIKPDIVGFDIINKKLHFIEVKIGELTILDIGQLLGYCLVAKPESAYLVSPKNPSPSLIKTLSSNLNLLSYGDNKMIKIGKWENNKINVVN